MDLTISWPPRVTLSRVLLLCFLSGLAAVLLVENSIVYKIQAAAIAHGFSDSAPSVRDDLYVYDQPAPPPPPPKPAPPQEHQRPPQQNPVFGALLPPPAAPKLSDKQLAELDATRRAINPNRAPLGVDPKNIDCEGLQLVDDKLPELPSYTVPSECGLGVVTVGMPRAGSSLETQVINHLIGKVVTNDRIINLYWDLHKHKRMQYPEVDQHLAEIDRKLKGIDEAKVIIAKTHEYIPGLFNLCKKTVIMSIRRNLLFSSRSIMLSNWVKQEGHEELIALHNLAIRRRACWLSNANQSLEVDYEDFIKTPEALLRLTDQLLDLGLKNETFAAIVDQNMSKEANLGFPSTKDEHLSEAQTRTIDRSLTAPIPIVWQKAMGYNSVRPS